MFSCSGTPSPKSLHLCRDGNTTRLCWNSIFPFLDESCWLCRTSVNIDNIEWVSRLSIFRIWVNHDNSESGAILIISNRSRYCFPFYWSINYTWLLDSAYSVWMCSQTEIIYIYSIPLKIPNRSRCWQLWMGVYIDNSESESILTTSGGCQYGQF